jgi:hypothetical protein
LQRSTDIGERFALIEHSDALATRTTARRTLRRSWNS